MVGGLCWIKKSYFPPCLIVRLVLPPGGSIMNESFARWLSTGSCRLSLAKKCKFNLVLTASFVIPLTFNNILVHYESDSVVRSQIYGDYGRENIV